MHSVAGMRVAQDTGPPPTWTTIEKSHPKSAPVLSWEPLVSQSEIECMTKNIYFEAAVESTAGQLAVAQVTLNRVKSKHYPNSVCEVVYEGPKHASGIMKRDRCQFSWYCDGKDDEVRNKGTLWNTAQSLAKYVLSRQKDLIDITYFAKLCAVFQSFPLFLTSSSLPSQYQENWQRSLFGIPLACFGPS